MFEYVIRGGTIVDGSGRPRFRGDLAIDRGRVVAVGEVDGEGRVEMDATDRVVAPGFIDIHTHYDAQMFWDATLSPSSWHGVTTVVSGNCGFGLAPVRAEHHDAMCEVLAGVEGMDLEALRVGVPWQTYETFSEYLDILDAADLQLNVGVLAGHTTIRLFVMGAEAMERAATEVEVEAMSTLLSAMLDQGAMGFSSSREASHRALDGRFAPSIVAELSEIVRLCEVFGDRGRGVIELSPGNPNTDIALPNETICEIAERSGRPVTWAALLTGKYPDALRAEILAQNDACDGTVFPQIGCRPVMFQVTLADPYAFNNIPAFEQVVRTPPAGRTAIYADPAWREVAAREVERIRGADFWERMVVQESTAHRDLVDGPSIAALATQRQQDPFDLMVEVGLADDLLTRFGVILANNDEAGMGAMLLDERCMLGISDAGAHGNQLCDASYPTDLLGHWVRELGVLTLEQAIWRLSGQPAEIFGIADRGLLEPGRHADIVVFDPATISHGPLERVSDLPGGADRLVVHSIGIDAIWVNGVQTRRGGVMEDRFPGRLLRAGG